MPLQEIAKCPVGENRLFWQILFHQNVNYKCTYFYSIPIWVFTFYPFIKGQTARATE